jgi:hypothetical protein
MDIPENDEDMGFGDQNDEFYEFNGYIDANQRNSTKKQKAKYLDQY